MSERSLHGFDDDTERLAHRILDYVIHRIRMSPPPLDAPRGPAELAAATGETITDDGLGWERALALFRDVLAPACISSDHPRYLGFVPTAPAEAATLFDLVVSASSIYGDWWIEGAGAIHAENQALRWLAGLAGLPETAGGVFVSGGTAGNLTAMTVARETWWERHGRNRVAGVACAPSAHSSIRLAAKVIDVPVVLVEADERGRLTGERLAEAIASADVDVFAAIATGGATNTGVVDDLDGVATVCHERGVWMHVDAAYGGAAMVAPSARPLFHGIERADSFVVDPHKWLFSPFDCAALLYRDPNLARACADPAGRLPRGAHPDLAMEPVGPRDPHDPPGAGAAAVVLAGCQRDEGLRASRGARAGPGTRGRTSHRRGTPPRPRDGARAVRRAVPPARLGSRRLPALVRRGTRIRPRPAGADGARGRDDVPLLLRQPAHHDRRHRARARRDALTAVSRVRAAS